MAWKPSDDELVHILDATNASVHRVRQVLIVMSTASIVVFAAVWNSLDFSWMRWRGAVAESREVWASYHQDANEKQRWDALRKKVADGKADPGDRSRLEAWEKKLADGEKYSAKTTLPLAQLREAAKKARDTIDDSAKTIRIPFFGVAVDINDTTIIGAFTLLIIMMWLRLALWRQCSNLNIAFFQANEAKRLEFAYRYASMQQVLTIPPRTADSSRRGRAPYGAPSILFCLPSTVVLLALINDLYSFKAVADLGKHTHAVVQTIFAGIFLAALLYLTFRCHMLRRESKRTWEHYFGKLQ